MVWLLLLNHLLYPTFTYYPLWLPYNLYLALYKFCKVLIMPMLVFIINCLNSPCWDSFRDIYLRLPCFYKSNKLTVVLAMLIVTKVKYYNCLQMEYVYKCKNKVFVMVIFYENNLFSDYPTIYSLLITFNNYIM